MFKHGSAAIDTSDNEPNQYPAGTEAGDDTVKTVVWTLHGCRVGCFAAPLHYNHIGICSHDSF